MADPPKDGLAKEVQARLAKLETSLVYDKITVSFSLEERLATGRRMSCFVSMTANKGSQDPLDLQAGFSPSEIDVVRCILSKKVVAATYADAILRGLISLDRGLAEETLIQAKYNALIAKKASQL